MLSPHSLVFTPSTNYHGPVVGQPMPLPTIGKERRQGEKREAKHCHPQLSMSAAKYLPPHRKEWEKEDLLPNTITPLINPHRTTFLNHCAPSICGCSRKKIREGAPQERSEETSNWPSPPLSLLLTATSHQN